MAEGVWGRWGSVFESSKKKTLRRAASSLFRQDYSVAALLREATPAR